MYPGKVIPPLGSLDAVPPALRYRLAKLGDPPSDGELQRLISDGAPWFGAQPELAELGYWLIKPDKSEELRRRGCIWLSMFPTVEMVKRVSAVALEPASKVRDQAIWTLGYRQLRDHHPDTRWSADALQIADDTLAKLGHDATSDGAIPERLAHACRHIGSDLLMAVFARAPGLWGDALEAFASPALARVLWVSLDDIPAQHRLRVLRLVGSALGEEIVPHLLHRLPRSSIDEQLEMLMLACALGGEKHLARLEDAIKDMQFAGMLRARAQWHVANKGVIPTVRGLRVARTTATIDPAQRAKLCTNAASDLAALARFERYAEAYVYTLWGWLVRNANDPVKARELVAAHPESQQLVRDLYLEDLARRGRVKQLAAAAQTLQGADLGALQLAIHGRPLAALELAATARLHTPELVCARALACYRGGRPDLAERILAEDLPPSEITGDELAAFPGANEQWLIKRGAPVLDALANGVQGVVALAEPAPPDAEPDTASLAATDTVERRLFRGLPGATVYLAGEFVQLSKPAIAAAVEKAGARLVNGPFPGTDYYVHGDYCLVQTIAQLERQGARRLRAGELEGI